jgi:hypothetical protein
MEDEEKEDREEVLMMTILRKQVKVGTPDLLRKIEMGILLKQ